MPICCPTQRILLKAKLSASWSLATLMSFNMIQLLAKKVDINGGIYYVYYVVTIRKSTGPIMLPQIHKIIHKRRYHQHKSKCKQFWMYSNVSFHSMSTWNSTLGTTPRLEAGYRTIDTTFLLIYMLQPFWSVISSPRFNVCRWYTERGREPKFRLQWLLFLTVSSSYEAGNRVTVSYSVSLLCSEVFTSWRQIRSRARRER